MTEIIWTVLILLGGVIVYFRVDPPKKDKAQEPIMPEIVHGYFSEEMKKAVGSAWYKRVDTGELVSCCFVCTDRVAVDLVEDEYPDIQYVSEVLYDKNANEDTLP